MISQGIGRGNIQTFEPMGKIQMSKGEPIKLSTTHFVFCAQSLEVVGEVISLDGKGMEVKFEFGKSPIFGKCVFNLWGK